MGKVIKKKLNGMSWWMKTSLILTLTLVTSVFMYQGWYLPNHAKAASKTYYIVDAGGAGTAIATGVSTTVAAGTNPTSATPTPDITLLGTASSATATNRTTGTYTAGATMLEAIYNTAYAANTAVTGTSFMTRFRDGSGGYTAGIQLFYVAANGTKTNFTGSVANQAVASAASADYTVNLSGQTVTVPAGSKLGVRIIYVSGTSTDARVYFGSTAAVSGLDGGVLIVDEVAAATAGTLAVSTATQTVAEAVGNATVSVTRTGGTTGAVTVDYATADGTALAGQDYTSTTGTLSWAAGDATAKTITIPITNDAYDEGNETFAVNLTNATNGASIGTAAQNVTITDDDATPTIGFTAATSSGSNSTTPATFTVALSSVSGQITSVPYTFTNGTAANGTDYTGTPGTLTIPALSPSGVISVPISAASAGGTFTINLGTPVNAGNGTNMSHVYTITALPPTTITQCGGCHGHPAGPNNLTDGTARNNPAGTFQGNHATHAPLTTDCVKCHTNPTTFDHSNGTIDLNAAISGGTYQKGTSVAVSNAAAFNTTNATCNNTTCHGGASSAWSTSTTQATCTKCHGVNTTSPAQYTADTKNAAPGYVSTAPVGTGRDTAGLTAATGAQVGAHDTHLKATNGISSPIACTECHSNVNTTSTTFTGHMDGAGTLSFGTLATSGAGTAPSYAGGTCSNTYCHYGRDTAYAPPATANAAVAWINTNYLTGVDTAAADCGKCHASPPLSTGTHAGGLLIADCNGCHSHVNTNGTFNNASLHINGTVEASGSCIGCHDKVQGTRSIITGASGEFGLAWGHKKSTRTAVTDSDCIVCHLEGDFTTQKAVNAPTGKHKDGNVDLRDPDGAGETAITNNSGAQFTFTKYAVAYTAGSRTTTLGNTVAEVVTAKFCLKCHDGDGALNPFARTRNATNTATTGTQYSPFEGVSTGYSVINGAAVANGVINVATQVASTNSSRHPVGAPNNRAYPASTRLVAPYNGIGTTRDANVQTGGGTGTRVKANSVVMVCDDCHTVTTAPGSVPTLLNRTITAHGTAQVENVRGTFMVTSPTLCLSCHGTAGITGNATTSQIDTTNGDHNPGSAFTTGTTRVATYMAQCQYCHFSAITKPARPIRAQDVHGFNGMQTTGAGWASGTVTGMRPVAFMRNVANWPAASPRPAVVVAGGTLNQIAVAAGQSTCAGTGDLGNASCSGQTGKHLNYSPGGSY